MKPNIPALLRRLLPTRHLSGARFSRRARRRSFRTEPLEVRTLLAGVSDTDGTLQLELQDGERLAISAQESGYQFSLSNGVFRDINLSSPDAFAGFGSNALLWHDLSQYSNVAVNDNGEATSLTFQHSVSAYEHSFDVQLMGLSGSSPSVAFIGNSDFGDFNVAVTTAGTIEIRDASLDFSDGDLSLDANRNGFASSSATGLLVVSSQVQVAGTGSLSLYGQGVDNADSSDRRGLWVQDSALLSNSGDIRLEGTGGIGVHNNHGIDVDTSTIETTSGNIELTGHTAEEGGFYNRGVSVTNTAIRALGSEDTQNTSANVRISGFASPELTSRWQTGVVLSDSAISVRTHDLTIEGEVSQRSSAGIQLGSTNITSLGLAAGVGNIRMRGMAHAGLNSSGISGGSGEIRSHGGHISIHGEASQMDEGTRGLWLVTPIRSTGRGDDMGHISIIGKGDLGADLRSVTSYTGDIAIHGAGKEQGVRFRESENHAAVETISGNIAVSAVGNEGIIVSDRLVTQQGNLHVQATGGINADYGMWINAPLEAPEGRITLSSDISISVLNVALTAGDAIEMGGFVADDDMTRLPRQIFLSQVQLETISPGDDGGVRLTGQYVTTQAAALRTGSGTIDIRGIQTDVEFGGLQIVRTQIESTTGNLFLYGFAENAILTQFSRFHTTTGDITIEGVTPDKPYSAAVTMMDTNVSSDSGDVQLLGHAGGQTDGDRPHSFGISLLGDTSVLTHGNVLIDGQSHFSGLRRGVGISPDVRIKSPNALSTVEIRSNTTFELPGINGYPVFVGTGNLVFTSTMDTTELSLWAPTTGHLIDRTILQAIAPGWNQVSIRGKEHARIKIGSVPVNSPLKLFGDADFAPNAQLHAVIGSSTQTLLTVTGHADIPAGVQLNVSKDPDWSPVEGGVLQILERQSGTGTFDGWTDGVVRNELFDSVVSALGSDGSTVSVQIPDTHIFVTPDRFQTNHPTFRWSVAPSANSWDVWLAAAGSREAIVDTNLDTPFFTMSEDLPLGQYFLYVRPVTADGRRLAWQAQALSVDVSPMASASISSAGLITTWQQVPGATHYRVVIQDLARGSVVVDITTAELTHHFERSFGRFRVWVRAINERGYSSTWTDPISLARGPQLVNSTVATFVPRPAFTWHKPEDAATYRIWIEHAGSVILNQAGINESQYQVPFDLAYGTYRWWVQPTSIDGTTGAWSQRGTVYVGGRTEIETIDYDPRKLVSIVRWLPVEGASSYEVFARQPSGQVVRAVVAADAELEYRFAMRSYSDHLFWVRAQSAQGRWGPWTQRAEFSRPAPAGTFRPSVPAAVVTTVPGEAALVSWSHQEGMTYHYVITNRGAITEEGTVDGNSLRVPEYGDDQAVYVVAEAADGTAGEASELVTLNYDGKSKITWPVGNISTTVSIAWTAVEGPAVRYQLQVQSVESGTVVVNEETANDSRLSEDLTAGTYRAWVRVLADGFTGPWSAAHEFTVV
ncbi:MAG: fibronectin type III domain-containing protein [Planctomycetaceae bacterium]|nr:fibronectin type III domain-containing protein [Planctomycetaceae bacterium]